MLVYPSEAPLRAVGAAPSLAIWSSSMTVPPTRPPTMRPAADPSPVTVSSDSPVSSTSKTTSKPRVSRYQSSDRATSLTRTQMWLNLLIGSAMSGS